MQAIADLDPLWPFEKCESSLARKEYSCYYLVDSKDTSQWIGFILLLHCLDSVDIIQFFVHTKNRRQGYGFLLLTQMFDCLKKDGVASIFLEVSVNNYSAIALYEKIGMEKVSTRKNYYANGDDALVFKTIL